MRAAGGTRRTRAHRRAQARVGECSPASSARSAREPPTHGVPLRPVAHLDQAVVVAEADHRGRPESAASGRSGRTRCSRSSAGGTSRGRPSPKRWRARKSPIGSASRPRRRRSAMRGGQPVEAQDVAPACARSAGAAGCGAARTRCSGRSRSTPGRCCGTCTEKRHVRRRGLARPARANRSHQLRVGALVEDQEAGVHAVRHAVQRARRPCALWPPKRASASNSVTCACGGQRMRDRQAADARADDGDAAHAASGPCRPLQAQRRR